MSEKTLTRESLLGEIDSTWNEFLSYLASRTEEELTVPADAAGWTVKDHLMHLAVWERAALAMIEGKSKRETLNISPEVWEQDDDPINAVLQERYQDMPLAEVMQTFKANHERLMEKVESMSKADLRLPYSHYQPQAESQRPIIDYIHWDTVSHYRDHLTWIKAIVEKA